MASEEDAKAVFVKTFGASLEVPNNPFRTPSKRNQPTRPYGLTAHLSPFVANLATWQITNDLTKILDQGATSPIQSILESRKQHIAGLAQTNTQVALPSMVRLVTTIAQLQPKVPMTPPHQRRTLVSLNTFMSRTPIGSAPQTAG